MILDPRAVARALGRDVGPVLAPGWYPTLPATQPILGGTT
jgi:hypothetical protein